MNRHPPDQTPACDVFDTQPWRTGLRVLWLLLVVLVFPGCVASIDLVEEHAAELQMHLQERTYFLFEGRSLDAVTFDPVKSKLQFDGHVGGRVGISTLTVISEDGYFLTNAHTLKMLSPDTRLWVVALNNGRPFFQPAEVVWRSDNRADLGLVWAPIPTVYHFEWAEIPQPAPRGTGLVQGGFRSRMKLGRVLWERENLPWLAPHSSIDHTVKARKGDSGGPLIMLDGRLLALNSQWRLYGGMAVRPDEAAIRQIMEEHRAKRLGLSILRE